MASERIQRRIERLLDQIEQEADQRNWQLVLELAREVLGFAPDNSDAKAFLDVAEERLASTAPAVRRSFGPMPAAAPTAGHPTSPSAELRTSFANGRYQVKEFLGEGGKKKVYLAHDGILDRDLALAVIKAEGLDDLSRTRITREAQAMGRLGDHPNIL
ncbi:MAG: hypothetical protein J4N78_10635, partial [Chloroflexi bacterium]|nr:hypothetical protein [Chloroflexota bacterium]